MTTDIETLRGGVVLAELGGTSDGTFCGLHGAGAAMVTMGTYIVDPDQDVPYPSAFVFQPDAASYEPYLKEHVEEARRSGGAVAVSAIGRRIEDVAAFFVAAEKAGADWVSLCAHSVMPMFLESGLGAALAEPTRAEALREWIREIVAAVSIPLMVKFNRRPDSNLPKASRIAIEEGATSIHANVHECEAQSPGLQTVRELAGHAGLLVICGGVRTPGDARRLLDAGADAVAVARAAQHDPSFCKALDRALREGSL